MSTQSHNLYDEEQINAIRREYGVNVTEAMAGAIEDVKDNVVRSATSVADGVAGVVRQASRDMAFFIAGGIFTLVVIVFARNFI